MFQIDILTIFPEMFESVFAVSILNRAQQEALIELRVHDLRDWTTDKHHKVDDRPFGGGPGMVMKVDVLHRAIKALKEKNPQAPTILLSPQGQSYQQSQAENFTQEEGLILIAGHYEGFDERIRNYIDLELSIGDYVLTGGEIPAMVVVDSVARLLPGVLGDKNSTQEDSFTSGQLDYPEYTKPRIYNEKEVPTVLLSGNHAKIKAWRQKKAEEKTKEKRPDLI